MDYHWGDERRLMERRQAIDPNYTGPERRQGERRRYRARSRNIVAPTIAAVLAFAMVDATIWNSYYWRAAVNRLNDDAATTRAWGANIWHLG